MKQLGIALYPQHASLEEMICYVDTAYTHGFRRIFTCLMSLSDGDEKQKLQDITAYAANKGFRITADVSPDVFRDNNLTYRDIYVLKKQYHLTGIRLDLGFSGQEEAFMSVDASDLEIELNISNGTKYVETILSYGGNIDRIVGCHNFYPRRYTGLSREHLLATSTLFKQNHVRTAAMISSQSAAYGPWEETPYGLPTLEEHRHLTITTQAKDLWHTGLIDDLIIGNMFASDEELAALGSLNRDLLELTVDCLDATTDVEQHILFKEPHFNRGDVSEYVIRSTQSRVNYKAAAFPPHDVQELQIGDVTIDNEHDVRYKGELQIARQSMQNSGSTNVVARVIEQERFLIQQVKPWESFGFQKG